MGSTNCRYQFAAAVDRNTDTATINASRRPRSPGSLTGFHHGAATETSKSVPAQHCGIRGPVSAYDGNDTDVVGTLYGPDGKQIAMDSDSGTGDNFRIAANVEAGLYLLEVKGANRAEAGAYELVTNFVTGDVVTTPTTPGTGTGTGEDLQDRGTEWLSWRMS